MCHGNHVTEGRINSRLSVADGSAARHQRRMTCQVACARASLCTSVWRCRACRQQWSDGNRYISLFRFMVLAQQKMRRNDHEFCCIFAQVYGILLSCSRLTQHIVLGESQLLGGLASPCLLCISPNHSQSLVTTGSLRTRSLQQ